MLIDRFNKAIKTPNQFELCDEVFCILSEKHGNTLDASSEAEPSRTITLVWHSMGLIGNGGFGYLFEGKFNGDPDFSITAESYKNIDAINAYNKFNEILKTYNSRTLFTVFIEWFTNKILKKESRTDKILEQFFNEKEQEKIQSCLSDFIKKNEPELRDQILGPRKKRFIPN